MHLPPFAERFHALAAREPVTVGPTQAVNGRIIKEMAATKPHLVRCHSSRRLETCGRTNEMSDRSPDGCKVTALAGGGLHQTVELVPSFCPVFGVTGCGVNGGGRQGFDRGQRQMSNSRRVAAGQTGDWKSGGANEQGSNSGRAPLLPDACPRWFCTAPKTESRGETNEFNASPRGSCGIMVICTSCWLALCWTTGDGQWAVDDG